MKFNDIDSFLNAIENRMEELKDEDIAVTSSTDINASIEFDADELAKFDSIKEEAQALSDGPDDMVDYICNRLADLGYTDDEITQILDYEGV